MQNLFADVAIPAGNETFATLLETHAIRIERIVSSSHASPDGFWYDQPDDEWVAVLKGEASIEFDPGGLQHLRAGDHIFIPRHTRHRVTSTGFSTVWLAIHLKAPA